MKFGAPKLDVDRLYKTPEHTLRLAVPDIIAAIVINLIETATYDLNSWASFSNEWGGWKPTGASVQGFFNEFWNDSLINLNPQQATWRDVAIVAGLGMVKEGYRNTK